jgi:type II restriction/modification system DNA methylase subunit YeeA
LNIAQIENNLQKLLKSFNKDSFIYDLILAYGLPKASVTRLQKGDLNLSKRDGEISWKKKLFFREIVSDDLTLFPKAIKHEDLQQAIDSLKKDPKILKHSPRFIIVTDYKYLLAVDTKTADTLDIKITETAKHFDFFLPWAGMEKAHHQYENPADVKAAERMAKLYDEIKKENSTKTPEDVHSLNVFLSRLLFCFFAEDTGIFEDGLFVTSISSHTQADGSDLDDYIEKLFDVLNTKSRKNLPSYLQAFPYVNGGLFKAKHKIPKFTHRSRQAIIESGELDWSAINPDIFGSMMQAVVTPEHRGALGMHYTSLPNIMKVICPLFLDELNEEFEKNKNNKPKLKKLLLRLSKIKIFDPACGSGNFLIIAYKELRKLEMKIIKHINAMAISQISLSHFYGIEIDDFAHEVAILSLWLAEHQMNVEFYKEFGRTEPTLPLKDAGNIVQGNACRLEWEKVCPKNKEDEVYVLGNPPYLGARLLDDKQKSDMAYVFTNKIPNFNDLDYIGCWFYKGSLYINSYNAKAAFVSTNSICQGIQVSLLWPFVLNNNIEIDFAHRTFKWANNAKSQAVVACVIIGLRNKLAKPKYIFENELKVQANNINPYLIDGRVVYIYGRNSPITNMPKMLFGSMPNDGGHLLISETEYTSIKNEKVLKYIYPALSAKEFINGDKRYCIWIEDDDYKEAIKIPFIKDRIDKVIVHRQKSERDVTRKLATIPYKFGEIRHKNTELILIPRHSSEKREYIPLGFFDKTHIVLDSSLAIYNAKPYIFGFIQSKIHMVWVKTIGGQLESRIRYSCELCYNTFPVPELSQTQKDVINNNVYNVLSERERHPEKTLAQLYDPDIMPSGLREAHHNLDLAVERCYRSKPFTSDEERLEYLFKLYEQMIAEEKANNGELSLFDEPVIKKTKRGQKNPE